jgi:hypothetical protein
MEDETNDEVEDETNDEVEDEVKTEVDVPPNDEILKDVVLVDKMTEEVFEGGGVIKQASSVTCKSPGISSRF